MPADVVATVSDTSVLISYGHLRVADGPAGRIENLPAKSTGCRLTES